MSMQFLLGAATAAHQVEGNNIHSDYWLQEQLPHSDFVEPSGTACDHYHRYAEDIRLMSAAGLNAYRFSIEWARIEPEEGRFDAREIDHYRDVIRCCHENGLEPIVSLHHFSSPAWLIRKGGWEAESTIEDFRRYAAHVADQLGDQLHFICTINEANMGLQIAEVAKSILLMAEQAKKAEGSLQVGLNLEGIMERLKYAAAENEEIFGTAQPHGFSTPRTESGDRLIMRAHQAAKAAIQERFPDIKVGVTLSLHDIQAVPGGEENAVRAWDAEFRHYLPYIAEDDFLGVQNYSRMRYGASGQLPCPEGAELTQMDYEFYPEALEHVLRAVHQDFKGDLIVTENGIATADDRRRMEFIRRALAGVQNCRRDGIPVKGYLYWSLLDNFEWQKGYSMTFGLIAVDRATQERCPKESLALLGKQLPALLGRKNIWGDDLSSGGE